MVKSRPTNRETRQDSSSGSVTIERARALLGSEADLMTDDDVREACRSAETLANIIVQMFLDTKPKRRMT